jgi:hypothetical protein
MSGGHRGCDHIVVGFTTCEISTYPGTPVSSTNKTDRHDVTEILLKVALNTINTCLYKNNIPVYLLKIFISLRGKGSQS